MVRCYGPIDDSLGTICGIFFTNWLMCVMMLLTDSWEKPSKPPLVISFRTLWILLCHIYYHQLFSSVWTDFIALYVDQTLPEPRVLSHTHVHSPTDRYTHARTHRHTHAHAHTIMLLIHLLIHNIKSWMDIFSHSSYNILSTVQLAHWEMKS